MPSSDATLWLTVTAAGFALAVAFFYLAGKRDKQYQHGVTVAVSRLADKMGLTAVSPADSRGSPLLRRGISGGIRISVGILEDSQRWPFRWIEIVAEANQSIGNHAVLRRKVFHSADLEHAAIVPIGQPDFEAQFTVRYLGSSDDRGAGGGPFRGLSSGTEVAWLTRDVQQDLLDLPLTELFVRDRKVMLQLALDVGPRLTDARIERAVQLALSLASVEET